MFFKILDIPSCFSTTGTPFLFGGRVSFVALAGLGLTCSPGWPWTPKIHLSALSAVLKALPVLLQSFLTTCEMQNGVLNKDTWECTFNNPKRCWRAPPWDPDSTGIVVKLVQWDSSGERLGSWQLESNPLGLLGGQRTNSSNLSSGLHTKINECTQEGCWGVYVKKRN